MGNKKERAVIAFGGNTSGNTLPEQIKAIKITAKAIADLIEEGCEVVVAHGNDPRVGMINNAAAALSREGANQPNTPLSVYVAMSQIYIGHDPQSASREEFCNHEMYDAPVATVTTQVHMDANNPAFKAPSKPVDHFITEEQARIAGGKYGYTMKGGSGRGFCRVVASPKPAEIIEIGAIRPLVDSGQLVIAYGGGDIPVIHQESYPKGANAVINKDFVNELLVEDLNADFLIILTIVEEVAINSGKPGEKWLDNLDTEEARQYIKGGYFASGSILPKVQAAVKFAESRPGCTALITLLEKAKDGVQGKTGVHIHLTQRRQ